LSQTTPNTTNDSNKSASNTKVILPAFVEAKIASMYPNASETQFAEIRAQCAEQLAHKQKLITQTNSEVLRSIDNKTDNAERDTQLPPNIHSRYSNSSVAQGFIYSGSTVVGKYGAKMAYDREKGSQGVLNLYPSLIVKSLADWYIADMKMTVTAKDPNGNTISGIKIDNKGT
jgi:hypothetical protein